MNLQFFRRPAVAMIMAFNVLVISSCSTDGTTAPEPVAVNIKSKGIDLQEVKKEHEQIQYYFTQEVSDYADPSILVETELKLNENIEYINKNGVEKGLELYGIDSKYVKVLKEMSALNSDEEANNYVSLNTESIEEAKFVLLSFEFFKLAIEKHENVPYYSLTKAKRMTFGCAVAITGGVLCTIAAMGVVAGATVASGGLAATLGFWVVCKVVATVGVMTSC